MQSIDIFRSLGKWCHQITIEHKNKLKTSLSQDCRNICDQDHSNSKLLFGDVLTENVRAAKAIYLTNQYLNKANDEGWFKFRYDVNIEEMWQAQVTYFLSLFKTILPKKAQTTST